MHGGFLLVLYMIDSHYNEKAVKPSYLCNANPKEGFFMLNPQNTTPFHTPVTSLQFV